MHRGRSGCSPHPRGDGPGPSQAMCEGCEFSPPAWGWSADAKLALARVEVLPTRVGMVRWATSGRMASSCSPHPRGDGPTRGKDRSLGSVFSPPAWGWSDHFQPGGRPGRVLPTRVGMVRTTRGGAFRRSSSPHPRGDGPWCHIDRATWTMFSPPAWGWSALPAEPPVPVMVLPTRVGMARAVLRSWLRGGETCALITTAPPVGRGGIRGRGRCHRASRSTDRRSAGRVRSPPSLLREGCGRDNPYPGRSDRLRANSRSIPGCRGPSTIPGRSPACRAARSRWVGSFRPVPCRARHHHRRTNGSRAWHSRRWWRN